MIQAIISTLLESAHQMLVFGVMGPSHWEIGLLMSQVPTLTNQAIPL